MTSDKLENVVQTPVSGARRKRQRIASPTGSKSCFIATTSTKGNNESTVKRTIQETGSTLRPSRPPIRTQQYTQSERSNERPQFNRERREPGNSREYAHYNFGKEASVNQEAPVYPHRRLSRNNESEFNYPYAKKNNPNPGKNNNKFGNAKRKKPALQREIKAQQPPIEPVKYPSPMASVTEKVRLNKFLANAGVCSRRDADKLIREGAITVNGQVVVEMGARVHPQDEVVYNGQKISLESKIYVLLNKPKNCVTTSDDPECRRTVMDLVKNACTERIYPVGRLDRNTTGVLLVTNDGDLASRLMHPSFKKKKIYHVWLNKPVEVAHMQQIAEGFELPDGEIHADAISYVKEDDLSQVGIEIHSGRNRIVRRIFEHFGYKVVKLDRVYFAGLTKKNLPRGRWRYLNEEEVTHLRMGIMQDSL